MVAALVLHCGTPIKAHNKGSSISSALPNNHKGPHYRVAAWVLHCLTPIKAQTKGSSINSALPNNQKDLS